MLIAMTGATGFIGARLSRQCAAQGHRVRILSRRPLAATDPGIETIRGDLADADSLHRLVDGAQAVIHLAAAVRGASQAAFDEPNVAGTARLLDAMASAAPEAALLFFSSLAAREPQLSFYAASKHRAEELVLRRRGSRQPTLILRPPAVYGPGDREMLPVFRFMARTGIAPAAGRATSRISLIYVDDLVAAALAWLADGLGISARCTLHDGHEGGYDWPELASIVSVACGRKVRVRELPAALLDAVAWGNRAMARIAGYAPMLTPAKLRELRHPDWSCDNTAIRALLPWQPRVELAEGLALTPGWHG